MFYFDSNQHRGYKAQGQKTLGFMLLHNEVVEIYNITCDGWSSTGVAVTT